VGATGRERERELGIIKERFVCEMDSESRLNFERPVTTILEYPHKPAACMATTALNKERNHTDAGEELK
jgi:hypothetical protein